MKAQTLKQRLENVKQINLKAMKRTSRIAKLTSPYRYFKEPLRNSEGDVIGRLYNKCPKKIYSKLLYAHHKEYKDVWNQIWFEK